LKTGRLKAVVATSSLELGIDMGSVDLVIQVESPPSVASGLQRIGRAGHQVGEISQGVLFPKHRTDLIGCAVTVRRMLSGQIETMRVPTNPLDVLAQHTVAACALEPLDADLWFDAETARLLRALGVGYVNDSGRGVAPALDGALTSPAYRLVYDRDAGVLTARPGAQRLAVTSGGAIPDRGLFTVYLASNADSEKPSRVGELDEEMVYESRPRCLRRDQQHHRDHPRPGVGDSRAGTARTTAVLARRRRRQARRAGRGDRRVHRRTSRAEPG
jgi:ATP-dependent Lhr-like helicase